MLNKYEWATHWARAHRCISDVAPTSVVVPNHPNIQAPRPLPSITTGKSIRTLQNNEWMILVIIFHLSLLCFSSQSASTVHVLGFSHELYFHEPANWVYPYPELLIFDNSNSLWTKSGLPRLTEISFAHCWIASYIVFAWVGVFCICICIFICICTSISISICTCIVFANRQMASLHLHEYPGGSVLQVFQIKVQSAFVHYRHRDQLVSAHHRKRQNTTWVKIWTSKWSGALWNVHKHKRTKYAKYSKTKYGSRS